MSKTRLLLSTGTALTVLLLGIAMMPDATAAPSPTNATLTIQKGGDRTAPQSVAGLAGATFDFFAGVAGTVPDFATATPDATCVTTAPLGRCSVDLPGRTGTNEGYWIHERSAPAGFSIASTLDTGVGAATTPTAYNQLFTGNVSNNQAYQFPLASTGSTNNQARGDYWADIRDDPGVPDHCGLNIALLIDVSGSIAPFLPQVKTAGDGFVDALTGTPSSIALFDFSTNASALLPATPVSDVAGANTVKAAIDGLTAGGATNWDAGLFQIASSSTTFDAVIMLTDGNPTVYGPPPAQGPQNRTRFREVENGIFSANAVKAKGTKVVAVGVGDGVSGAADNLKAISGPVQGQDYIQTGYAELGQLFHDLALKTCAGTVSVVKMVVPPSGDISQGVATGGWQFDVTSNNTTPLSGQTADGTGAVSFSADLSGGATSVPVTVQETVQPGYTLQQNAGNNATCTMGGNPVSSTNVGPAGFTVDAVRDQIVSCVVYNRAPQPPATVQVVKQWTINGTQYTDPAQPLQFEADLSLTGQVDPQWGTQYGGYTTGDDVDIAETLNMTIFPTGCTNVPGGDLGTHTLVAGDNVFTVTNIVTCNTHLTLLKDVQNPFGTPEPADSWTLDAYPPGSNTPFITGTTGVNGDIEPGVTYPLGESTVPGYAQELDPNAVIVPPATGTWRCRNRLRDGGTSSTFDGINGTVTAQIGAQVECTATNTAQPAHITLHKTVSNTHGGTAGPGDWIISAIPDDPDAPSVSGRDGLPDVTDQLIFPGVDYTVGESDGPPGYERVGDPACVVTGTDTPIATQFGRFIPTIGLNVTCTIANRDIATSPSASPSTSASPSVSPSVPPTSPPATPSASPTGPPIPITGTRIAPMAIIGGLALLSGLGLLILVRRRRWASESD